MRGQLPRDRLAFVSAPGGSAFMEEILAAVADAVAATGTSCLVHSGFISDVAEPGTRFVVVPHEYFALAPDEPPELYARTVGFGVEHPGTKTFASAVEASRRLGARFEISLEAVEQLHLAGLTAEHFAFGYVKGWDHWEVGNAPRPVDVIYLGTADDRRLGVLARIADDLHGLSCELLIPPHEPMTRERPDFLPADLKWSLLARSKVLINLHREDKSGFEWIRALEAMANGCVVVSEPSTDLAPFVPGEHLLVAEPSRIGAVARAAATNEPLRRRIADGAYRLCRSELRMDGPARRLVEVALGLDASTSDFPPLATPAGPAGHAPLAVWIPEVSPQLPGTEPAHPEWLASEVVDLARLRSERATITRAVGSGARHTTIDLLCVRRPGDGPLGATLNSLRADRELAAIHIACSPADEAAGINIAGDSPTPPGEDIATLLMADLLLGRGASRNLLLECTQSELVCVVDSGDEVRPGALKQLAALMTEDPDLDVVFAMATHGSDRMVNVLVPEPRRMANRVYLTRGFLARRRLLERIGGFSEEPLVEGFVDHVFWRDTLAAGASVRLARWIGFSLWPQNPGRLSAEYDPIRARHQILIGPPMPV